MVGNWAEWLVNWVPPEQWQAEYEKLQDHFKALGQPLSQDMLNSIETWGRECAKYNTPFGLDFSDAQMQFLAEIHRLMKNAKSKPLPLHLRGSPPPPAPVPWLDPNLSETERHIAWMVSIGRGKKRGQVPFYCCFGLPGFRIVASSPSFLAVSLTHAVLP